MALSPCLHILASRGRVILPSAFSQKTSIGSSTTDCHARDFGRGAVDVDASAVPSTAAAVGVGAGAGASATFQLTKSRSPWLRASAAKGSGAHAPDAERRQRARERRDGRLSAPRLIGHGQRRPLSLGHGLTDLQRSGLRRRARSAHLVDEHRDVGCGLDFQAVVASPTSHADKLQAVSSLRQRSVRRRAMMRVELLARSRGRAVATVKDVHGGACRSVTSDVESRKRSCCAHVCRRVVARNCSSALAEHCEP